MRIVINAGHTKIGKGSGAVGLLNESKETRKISCELMSLLADTQHEVIPAIFDKSNNNLKEAVDLSNNKNADLFLSIHLNAGGGNGFEVYTWNGCTSSITTRLCNEFNKLGFRNRGVKKGNHLYVIKNTKCNALLIECCFINSDIDKKKYNASKIANAIYESIK